MANYRRDDCKLFGIFPDGLDYPCFVTWAETQDEAGKVLQAFLSYGVCKVVTQGVWRAMMEMGPATFVKSDDPVTYTATVKTPAGLIQWIS